jgi:outer membrane lipoprotein SlyB
MNRKNLVRGASVAMLALAAVAGCATTPEGQKLQGQLIGGATGAALGSMVGGGNGRVVATGAGAVMGTVVGGNIASR